jgi:tetratricopeptide (TPR) repeat protein
MRSGLLLLVVALLVTACGTPVPTAIPAPQSAEEYVERAESFIEEELYPEAIEDLSAALEMEPEDAETYFLRGRTHYDYAVKLSTDLTGQPPEAVPFLPEEVVAEMELAVADYSAAIELDAQYAKAYNNRGNAYATLGDLEQALADYDRALELDDSLDLTYFNRGVIYYKLGNYEAAIADLEMYLQLVPEAEDRARLEGLIEEMRDTSGQQ